MATRLNDKELKAIRALSLEGTGTPHGKALMMDRARQQLLSHIDALGQPEPQVESADEAAQDGATSEEETNDEQV